MKAAVVVEFGGPETLCVVEALSPSIADDQVLIDVHYAGVNFPDTLIIRGQYQFQPEMPFSPGGEVSGIVREAGKSISHVKKGDRVISGCGWGGYAEQVASFGANTYQLPDSLPLREGACLLQTYATSYHALIDRGNARKGETLLVLGAAGGTGTSAVQLGKALGLTVIACASTNEKRAFCEKIGADATLDSNHTDIRKHLEKVTNGKGIDLIYDPVGGALSEKMFRSLSFGGRHLVVGFAQGTIPAIPWNLPLLKSASIVGVFWGGFFRKYPDKNAANVNALFALWEAGHIQPIIHSEYSLEEAHMALSALEEKSVMGKMVVKIVS